MRAEYASTSSKIEGALWRCLGGVTHVIGGWNLQSYDQVTRCGVVVRYRRGEWLYEALGLAPTFPNCVTCASDRWVRYSLRTVTGRMSYGKPNFQPIPPRTS